jgi:phosphoglycolate phosphatase-like HAD superfamily hydrolase
MAHTQTADLHGIRALMFDLMGTCVDWKSSIVRALEQCPPLALHAREDSTDFGLLAMEWRAGFFKDIFAAFKRDEETPDIDVVHRRVLDGMLERRNASKEWNEEVRSKLVAAWHSQTRLSL